MHAHEWAVLSPIAVVNAMVLYKPCVHSSVEPWYREVFTTLRVDLEHKEVLVAAVKTLCDPHRLKFIQLLVMARHTHLHLAFGMVLLSLFIGVSNGVSNRNKTYGACFNTFKGKDMKNISLDDCRHECTGFERYEMVDVLERISLWIVPLIVLVGNFQVPPFGSLNTIYSVIHLLGDPIDSICSLLTKLEVSKRLHARWVSVSAVGNAANNHGSIELEGLAGGTALRITPEHARDIATVNAIFDDWGFSTNSVFEIMFQTLTDLDAQGREKFIAACIDAAHRLSESRADERRRTSFAVLGYIVAIIAAFLKSLAMPDRALDRKTAFSIAFAMSMSGLIPAVVLSTTVGSFTSNRAAVRIIRDLQAELGDSWPIPDPETRQVSSRLSNPFSGCVVWNSCETLEDALPYGGGNYSYRPSKHSCLTGLLHQDSLPRDRSTAKLYIYSVLPLIIGVGCAIYVTVSTPTTGFSCRLLLTWTLGCFLTGKYRWYATLIKDFVIALTIWGLIFSAFVGVFNTCFCWSAWFSRHGGAYIEIKIDDQLEKLSTTTWPALVGLCIGGHGLVVLLMLRGNLHGVQLFSRDESERRESHRRLSNCERTITRRQSDAFAGRDADRRTG
ncbi:hypothetical protein K440DRAFT_677656 [Wilcoxina mikolae CBS 423.85]|nr:hypothetical protein K440DRAFT_677656 [Wilcoxina mikolae CBS 423.85]